MTQLHDEAGGQREGHRALGLSGRDMDDNSRQGRVGAWAS
jgi:hypothetical protein